MDTFIEIICAWALVSIVIGTIKGVFIDPYLDQKRAVEEDRIRRINREEYVRLRDQ